MSGFFPPSRQIEHRPDDHGHEAGQGVAQPEAAAIELQGEAQQGGQADAGDDAVDDGHGQVEFGFAGAVDEGEGHGAGGGAVEIEDDGQGEHGGQGEHLGIGGKDAINGVRPQQHGGGEQRGQADAEGGDGRQDLVDAPVFPGAQILTHHGAARRREGLADDAAHDVDLVEHPGQGGIGDVEQVDPAGQDDLAEIHGRGLDGHGNAQGQQTLELRAVDAEAGKPEIKAEALPVAVEICDGGQKADALADHRGQRRAEHGQAQIFDEYDVQHDVQHRRDADEHKGPLAVAHAAQDSADDVVAIDEHQSAHAGDHVIHGVIVGGGGRVEPAQHRKAQAVAYRRHDQRKAEQKGEHGADSLADVVVALGAHRLSDDHLARRGKAHGHKGEQVQDVAADGYGAHARLADVIAHDHHIHQVVYRLQGVGYEQRQGETDQKGHHRAPGHIPHHGFRHGITSFATKSMRRRPRHSWVRSAYFAPASWHRVSGFSSTWQPRRPALTQMVSNSWAVSWITVGNGFFMPMGEQPPWM